MTDVGRQAKADVVPLLKGGAAVVTGGILISVLRPSGRLPGAWSNVSDVLGILYTAAWSYSFYPQFLLNWRRKSVEGLSIEFQMLNMLGFACYSAYNVALFCVPAVQHEYVHAYSKNIPVGLEDVAFSVHAALITAATLAQCVCYDRGGQPLFSWVGRTAAGIGAAALAGCALVGWAEASGTPGRFSWLNFLLLLSAIKLVVTLTKYIPQVVMNIRRRSTAGWSIHNVLLDFTGGTTSLVQLLLQCAVQSDWSQIAGNPVKFGLGFISLFFDVTFMVQHYVIYREPQEAAAEPSAVEAAASCGASPDEGQGLLPEQEGEGSRQEPLDEV